MCSQSCEPLFFYPSLRLVHLSNDITMSSEAVECCGKNSLEQTKLGLNGDNVCDNIITVSNVMSEIPQTFHKCYFFISRRLEVLTLNL